MRDKIEAALHRLETAKSYGSSVRTCEHVLIDDAIGLLNEALAPPEPRPKPWGLVAVLICLFLSGCATPSPLALYLEHQEAGSEKALAFQDQEYLDLAAICKSEPDRCSKPALLVRECFRVRIGDGVRPEKVQYCGQSERARILTEKFWAVQAEEEFVKLGLQPK